MDATSWLGGWEGYQVETIQRRDEDGPSIWIFLGRSSRLERLAWLDRYARVTCRLADSVVRLCRALPVKQVAAFFGLHWSTVKEIDKRALQRDLDPVDFRGVEVLAMDEFAIPRGHRYATVVIEPYTRRVLRVGRERSREGVRPIFDLLGGAGCRRI